jgi:putative transposase
LKNEYLRLKGIYGYRRMWILLEKKYGIKLNRKKVYRILKEMGLQSQVRKRRVCCSSIGLGTEVHPNFLARKFLAVKPQEKWVTDITVLVENGQRYYLSAILDLFNREILGYKIGRNMDLSLVMESVKEAIGDKDVRGLMIHSDQGGHYTSNAYCMFLKKKGIIQSMSGRGNCLDNAVMENFFGHLKSELIYNKNFRLSDSLVEGVCEYIRFYNNERIQEKLNKMAPVEYRSHLLSA